MTASTESEGSLRIAGLSRSLKLPGLCGAEKKSLSQVHLCIDSLKGWAMLWVHQVLNAADTSNIPKACWEQPVLENSSEMMKQMSQKPRPGQDSWIWTESRSKLSSGDKSQSLTFDIFTWAPMHLGHGSPTKQVVSRAVSVSVILDSRHL